MADSYMYTLIKDFYDTPGIAEGYGRRTNLLQAEEAILEYLIDEIRDRRVLDIGVGPGRTTHHLSPLTKGYVGIDYSERMLGPCRERYPDATLLHCDARAMPFDDESFDVVFFSWNAIDDVDHDDRMAMLREIRRVLRAGGQFVFSAHNLATFQPSALRPRGFTLAGGLRGMPARNSKALRKYLRGIANRMRFKKMEHHEEEYSILNDQVYDYGLLTYYISKENQIRQLRRFGFGDVRMVAHDGSFIAADAQCTEPWIFYISRKLVAAAVEVRAEG
jgi:ubiquinone/menaquinone biosynthesis C-methylase UbiE